VPAFMRSAAAILAVFAAAGACALFAFSACSSDDSGASPDASVGSGQPLGAACDSTLASPCVAPVSSCTANVCTDGVCTEFVVDASASCSIGDAGFFIPPVNSLCTTSSDCDGGALCGFLAVAGCTVTGVCVAPLANGSLPPPACGCNGQPDPYIATDFTGAPASSPVACEDAGPGDDAGLDAASDDAQAADANDGAPE